MEDTLFGWKVWLLQFSGNVEAGTASLKPTWWFDHIEGAYAEYAREKSETSTFYQNGQEIKIQQLSSYRLTSWFL